MQSLCWHAGKKFWADRFLHTDITRILRVHLFTSRTGLPDTQELLQLPKIHLVKINPWEKTAGMQLHDNGVLFDLKWGGDSVLCSAVPQSWKSLSLTLSIHLINVSNLKMGWRLTKENIQCNHISVCGKNASFHTSSSVVLYKPAK